MSRSKRQKNGMINKEKENIIDSAEPENNFIYCIISAVVISGFFI